MQKTADWFVASMPMPKGRSSGYRTVTKTLLVMKLTLLLLTAAFLQVHAAGTAQTVTFSGKAVPLKKVLTAIEKQTGYYVFSNDDLLEKAKPVTLAVHDMPLRDFLETVLKNQPLTYRIEYKTISLALKETPDIVAALPPPSTAVVNALFATPIKGIVRDTSGKSLVDASVKIKGTQTGVHTDIYGAFTIQANQGDILVFSYIGYQSLEMKVKGTGMFVTMKPSSSPLDDVQVIAYGTTTRRFNTGNVTTVKAEDIARQPVTNFVDALSGLIPGLLITQQNGVPGSAFKVELRGRNSALNPGDPLYIIDGIPYSSGTYGQVAGDVMSSLGKLQTSGNSSEAGQMGLSPLNSINPGDIESIDVLKDGDATAIYGSRGANGVILITTKKGKTGPTRVSANVYQGITSLSKAPRYLNTAQYLQGRHEVFRNDGTTPGANDFDLNGTWDTTLVNDIAKEMIHSSSTTSAQLSISGGAAQTQYSIGVNYSKVSPPYDGNFSDKRIGATFSVTTNAFNNKLRVTLSGSYSVDNNTIPGMNTFGLLNLPPMYPSFHKTDGKLNWWSTSAINPYAQLLRTYRASTKMLMSNVLLSYQIAKGLELKSSLGYTTSQFNENRQNPLAAMNPLLSNNVSTSLWGNNSGNTWIFEPSIDYKHRLYKGTLNVLAGATMQENLREGQTITGYNFLTDAALNNVNAAAQTLLNNVYSKYHYAAVFGRINYQLMDKYVLNLTGRRDGSSRFAPDKRVANFGAVGAAWIFSEEEAVKRLLPFLSYGKLRGSYGLTGNDGIGDYRYLNTYTVNPNKFYNQPGLFPTRLFSQDYSWESNRKLEGALELGFLKDRIVVTASRFRNRCSNQLVNMTMAPTAGISSVQANLPALIENTGWEFELKTKIIDKNQINWTASFNLSTTRNKLLDFPGLATSPYANQFVVGQPLSLTKLYHGEGVDPLTGLYQFRRSDGSITILGLTAADQTVLRNTNPDFYGMFNNNFKYKNWSLYVTFRFMKQTGKNILFSNQTMPFISPVNVPVFFVDEPHWQKPGDIVKVQKYSNAGYAGSAYSAASNSDMAYTDASYIRCKNIGISYQLSQAWLKRLHLSGASLFCNMQNLFTISGYLGYDPETQGSNLPPMRTMAWGLQVTL